MTLDLSAIRGNAADQERGRWFVLVHPVSGVETGIRLRIAGPDSATQRRAQLALADRLAELADDRGRVSAKDRETARQEALAASVLDWEALEAGEPVPFTTANVLRLIRVARWVEAQIDFFAGDRTAFWGAE